MTINMEFYSPVQQLHNGLFEQHGVEVFIKRDDLIHPFISGNKWRKLKYPLRRAQAEGKTHLVTFGGAFSNHLLATAAAAAIFGFKATGIVRGDEVDNDTLFLCKMHGMQLMFTDREAYRDKRGLFEKYFGADAEAIFIDEGGSSAEGALGCSELVSELPEQYHHIFCACGTGTTAAGIINGLEQQGLPTQFHAVPVLKGGDFMRDEITRYLNQPVDFNLHTGYHFGGYAKTTPELLRFVQQFTKDTGIMIEPVYTGKLLYAVFDKIAQGYFTPGSRILVIHTGGLLGALGMRERFVSL